MKQDLLLKKSAVQVQLTSVIMLLWLDPACLNSVVIGMLLLLRVLFILK